MSRLKNFSRSVATSYLFIGVNVLYTLASVPLALHYLSKAEFGLWAVTLQIAGYIALIDLGMGSSVARILIDHKDDRAGGRYGAVIKSGFLVGSVQAALVLVVGFSIVWFMAAWLKVPPELSRSFLWLIIGQVLITAAMFLTRISSQLLYAWQRIDVYNYSQIVQLILGFGALWGGFLLGFGVYSLLAGSAVLWFSGAIMNFLACYRLGFFPRAGEWGQASGREFRELFSYGADVFLIGLGTQLIISSQTVLVSRQLGLEAAALWSVMTKAFTLVSQIVWRIIGNAMPAFAEMRVRKEDERMWNRFRGLFIIVSVFAGICAILFAGCNGPFVRIWTHNRFSWPLIDNVLLGLWLVASAQQCCHNSLIMNLKEIKGLKYVYLTEGVVFIGVALMILPVRGLTGMLICSLGATTLFTWLAGTWRVANLSGKGWKQLLWNWQLPLFRQLIILVPCWLGVEWIVHGASDWVRLIVNGGVLTLTGLLVALRFALPRDLTVEILDKLPRPLKRLGGVLAGPSRDCHYGRAL
ncbi:MAG: lipopolysaccharide biosynthesis protein [Limisphaerales bacterium]